MTAAPGAPVAHSFRRPELLQQALTHRSFSATNYERLEFIGDAVLDCVVSAVLYDRFPKLPEGDLSRMRASLVNEPALVRVARRIDLGPHLRVGEGERRSGSADKPSILADALEAVFGAVFVDAGFEAAREVILDAYGDILDDASPTVLGKDAKTRLQEWLQARKHAVPEYVIVASSGDAHAKTFEVECRIPALDVVTVGRGTSRRIAEQAAAEDALARIVAAHGSEPRGGR
ncbi:MAG: ribonuclease III [Burkholderiales bacterium]